MRRLIVLAILAVSVMACSGPPGAGSGAPSAAPGGSVAPAASSPGSVPDYGY